jgi:hypothetical protein
VAQRRSSSFSFITQTSSAKIANYNYAEIKISRQASSKKTFKLYLSFLSPKRSELAGYLGKFKWDQSGEDLSKRQIRVTKSQLGVAGIRIKDFLRKIKEEYEKPKTEQVPFLHDQGCRLKVSIDRLTLKVQHAVHKYFFVLDIYNDSIIGDNTRLRYLNSRTSRKRYKTISQNMA